MQAYTDGTGQSPVRPLDYTAQPFAVFAQSDRRKNPEKIMVRRMTRAEVMALGYGNHPEVLLNNGRLGTVKINGSIKTWKTDPDRVEIPVKYGMYEMARLSLSEALNRFVVRIYSAEAAKAAAQQGE